MVNMAVALRQNRLASTVHTQLDRKSVKSIQPFSYAAVYRYHAPTGFDRQVFRFYGHLHKVYIVMYISTGSHWATFDHLLGTHYFALTRGHSLYSIFNIVTDILAFLL